MRRALALPAFALALALSACASAPRPASLNNARAASTAPAVVQAKTDAPQAFAHAEQLRARAEAAYADGRQADAEFLGEHALAAYRRAVIAGRLSAAEARAAAAEASAAERERELALLDEQNRRALAEAENIELKLKVAREVMPVAGTKPASPDRERARLEVARSLALEARLLCTSARLLEPQRASLVERFGKLDALDKRLAAASLPAPIDDARLERSSCLRELTLTRRPHSDKTKPATHADVLLSELSGSGVSPSRDDRGVVVTLRDVFARGDAIAPAGREALASLGRIAKAHPGFPVLVVVHAARRGPVQQDQARASAAAKILSEHGAGPVEGLAAGAAQPVLDPAQSGATARNERVEVVFVAPTPI